MRYLIGMLRNMLIAEPKGMESKIKKAALNEVYKGYGEATYLMETGTKTTTKC